MTGPEIQLLTADDWAQLRDARLAALVDAPYAFQSTLAEEQQFTEQRWRERASTAGTFAARDGDAIVGLATGIDEGRDWHLVGVWVSPTLRGSGVAERLVSAVCELARQSGATSVRLWVTEENGRARAFYRRFGFVPSGRRQLVRPEDPSRWEEELDLRLR